MVAIRVERISSGSLVPAIIQPRIVSGNKINDTEDGEGNP
jgi:hypothetical protein